MKMPRSPYLAQVAFGAVAVGGVLIAVSRPSTLAGGSIVLCGVVLISLGFLLQRARAHELADLAESLPGATFQCRSAPADAARPHYTWVSRSVAGLLGVEREALLRSGDAFWDRVVDDDKPSLATALSAAVRRCSQTWVLLLRR